MLLISIDTLRADHVGAYGATSGATPNLDRIARDGVRFDRAISAAPLTLPSHATILSGILPLHHGVHNNGAGAFPSGDDTLAKAFQRAGYKTGAFVGAFVLDRRYGLSAGFDRYDDEIDRNNTPAGELEAERPGGQVTDRAIEWIGGVNAPFFAWVHLYDPHAPYQPPEPFRARFAASPYDGEIAYADAQVGRLLAMLETKGLLKNTIVVVTGDHGEALGEHGELTHGLLLYEPTLRVPLLVEAPGLAATVVREPVSLADIAPTVAALGGVSLGNGGKVDGRDLSAALRGGREPAAAEIYSETRYPEMFGWSALAALRLGNAKLISSPDPQLFDLAKDPGETTNALDTERRAYHDLSARLETLRAGEAVAVATTKPDPEAMAKLASLGYVGGAPAPGTGPAPDPRAMAPLFRRFEEATWALGDGKLDQAIAGFESLVKDDPRNSVFRGSLAKALRQKKDYKRAIALYQEAVALAPGDNEAWYNLAVALQEAGRGAQAAEAMKQALRGTTRQPEAQNVLGLVAASQGKPLEAIEAFQKAVALDPRNALALNNLGNALKDAGRFDEAADAYQRAVAVDPRYADPLNGLGALEVQRDRPQLALGYFDRAAKLAPGNLEIVLNRAIAYEMSGNSVAAMNEYQEFLRAAGGRDDLSSQRRVAEQLLARLRQREPRS